MTAREPQHLVLGVHPTSRGFAWVAFEGPFAVYDFGSVYVRTNRNVHCLKRFERLLDRLSPECVVFEGGAPHLRAGRRVVSLHRAMVAAAAARNVEVAGYARQDVQQSFAVVGARTRQEIAEAVARQLPQLAHRLPKRRQAWDGQDRRIALFAAAALVLTHFHLGANKFFEDLNDAA